MFHGPKVEKKPPLSLGIETQDSAQYRFVRGQTASLQELQQLRGRNQNHNPDMKEIFKNTATKASCICLAFFPLERREKAK